MQWRSCGRSLISRQQLFYYKITNLYERCLWMIKLSRPSMDAQHAASLQWTAWSEVRRRRRLVSRSCWSTDSPRLSSAVLRRNRRPRVICRWFRCRCCSTEAAAAAGGGQGSRRLHARHRHSGDAWAASFRSLPRFPPLLLLLHLLLRRRRRRNARHYRSRCIPAASCWADSCRWWRRRWRPAAGYLLRVLPVRCTPAWLRAPSSLLQNHTTSLRVLHATTNRIPNISHWTAFVPDKLSSKTAAAAAVEKRWQFSLHCHLRRPDQPVVLGCNYETATFQHNQAMQEYYWSFNQRCPRVGSTSGSGQVGSKFL